MAALQQNACWADAEVSSLLDIWSDSDVQKQLIGARRNKRVFEEISKRLRAVGVPKTAVQAREKIKKLRAHYVKVRTNNSKTGASTSKMKFYDDLHRVLGSRPIIEEPDFAEESSEMAVENCEDYVLPNSKTSATDISGMVMENGEDNYVQPTSKIVRQVRKRISLDEELVQPDPVELAILEHLQNTRRTMESKDNVQLFLDSLVEPLRRLTPKQFALARIKMDSVVYEITYESTDPV